MFLFTKIKKYYFEIILVLLIPVFYWHNIQVWISEWINPDSFYAFGIFTFGFIIYFIHNNFDKLAQIEKKPSNIGFLPLLIGITSYILGVRTGLEHLTNLSLPFLIGGIILILYGKNFLKSVLLPLFLFAFTLPIFSLFKITMPLQLISATLTSLLLNMLGVPSFNEGTIVNLGQYKLSVVAGCSGLKSITSLLFFSIMSAFFIKTKSIKKVFLVLFSIPLAIAMNILRVTLVGFYTLYNGIQNMEKFHDGLGIVFFIISISIVFFISKSIDETCEEGQDA